MVLKQVAKKRKKEVLKQQYMYKQKRVRIVYWYMYKNMSMC